MSLEPFQWGQGGQRMTPEQIEQQRKIAASLMQPDYSPIASPWQGLARVAGNLTGALQAKRLDKAEGVNADYNQQAIARLLAPDAGQTDIAGALSSADLSLQGLGMQIFKQQHPAPRAPHYWETNNGSLAMVGEDGQPQVVYQDPTPKVDWVTTTNPDGTKTLVPMQQGSGAMPALPTAPVGKLTPLSDGGPTPPASGSFR